jgi:hypothetical protein
MKSAAALCLLLASAARAQAPEGLPAFGAVGFAELRAMRPAAFPTPRAAAADVITANHLIVQAGTDVLFGYADNDADYQEAAAYWTSALKAAGVQPGTPSFEGGMYQIPYATGDGTVLVTFLADARQFAPKDEGALRADMALAQSALTRDGLTPLAARVINVDVILPTYLVLYKTKPDANPDHEARLRLLAPGDDMDFDVFRAAGLDVVETPKTWMMVYVGPAAGYVSLAAKSADDLAQKLSDREDFLAQNGKKVLATRDFSIDDPDYKFGVGVYFLQ